MFLMFQRQGAGELAAEQAAGLAEAEGLVSWFFWASFLGQVVLKGAKKKKKNEHLPVHDFWMLWLLMWAR